MGKQNESGNEGLKQFGQCVNCIDCVL